MRVKLLIAYKGTDFHGWQIQLKPSPPPTIQGTLQSAFKIITGLNPVIHASGRTDSGAHAIGQVLHLDLPDLEKWKNFDWRNALNALLPISIRVRDAVIVSDSFHARKDAIAKTYIYNYWTETAYVPPHLADFVFCSGTMNQDAIRSCFPLLCGEHDFASFQNSGTPVESTLRTVISIELQELPQECFYSTHSPFLRLSITANGFLKQMARNIAGFLWKVGQGKLEAGMLNEIFAAKDRQRLNAPTAPAKGLSLAKVYYQGEDLPQSFHRIR